MASPAQELYVDLIRIARRLYLDEPFGVDLKDTVYALDSTSIGLCLALFPWAPFRSTKAAIKLRTLIELRGNIPSFIHISDRKLHDVNVLDELLPEPGAFYLMDRGYLDFERLHRLHLAVNCPTPSLFERPLLAYSVEKLFRATF